MDLYCFCFCRTKLQHRGGLQNKERDGKFMPYLHLHFHFLDEKLHVCAVACSITVNTAIVELIYKFHCCCCLCSIYYAFVKFFKFIANFIASSACLLLCIFFKKNLLENLHFYDASVYCVTHVNFVVIVAQNLIYVMDLHCICLQDKVVEPC